VLSWFRASDGNRALQILRYHQLPLAETPIVPPPLPFPLFYPVFSDRWSKEDAHEGHRNDRLSSVAGVPVLFLLCYSFLCPFFSIQSPPYLLPTLCRPKLRQVVDGKRSGNVFLIYLRLFPSAGLCPPCVPFFLYHLVLFALTSCFTLALWPLVLTICRHRRQRTRLGLGPGSTSSLHPLLLLFPLSFVSFSASFDYTTLGFFGAGATPAKKKGRVGSRLPFARAKILPFFLLPPRFFCP